MTLTETFCGSALTVPTKCKLLHGRSFAVLLSLPPGSRPGGELDGEDGGASRPQPPRLGPLDLQIILDPHSQGKLLLKG